MDRQKKGWGSVQWCTISLGHDIFVVPSLSSFSGSSDKVFTYVRLSPTHWESFMSASTRTVRNIWNITVTGVVDGYYSSDLHVITDDTFFQRPALYFHIRYVSLGLCTEYLTEDFFL